jgi:D-alanine-D-alanine ligase
VPAVAPAGIAGSAAGGEDVAAMEGSGRKKVLHLVGSRQDEFYHDLSILYARACDDCPDLDHRRYEFLFAVVHLDGTWSFPAGLSDESLAVAPHLPMAVAVAHISALAPDVMVPHMFCVEGMTRFRSLFDLLRIPFLGNHEYTVWPATDKATTKQLLSAAGVQVPRGELLEKGRRECPDSVRVPFVVKPCNEDNSRGITLVRREEDAAAAIEYAFSFDPRVVIDEYIAGREVRAACVEEADGSLTVLPKIEYFLTDIRTSAHKLLTDKNGKLTTNAIKAAKKDGDRQCPADLSPQLHARIDAMVKEAHRVLKCRHYSLYDLRIDADEQPYILEAALFCSFSPLSVIPAMAQHAGREDLRHPNLFHSLLERAVAEKQREEKTVVPMCPVAPPPASDDITVVETVDTLGGLDTSGASSSRESDLASGAETSESEAEASVSDR